MSEGILIVRSEIELLCLIARRSVVVFPLKSGRRLVGGCLSLDLEESEEPDRRLRVTRLRMGRSEDRVSQSWELQEGGAQSHFGEGDAADTRRHAIAGPDGLRARELIGDERVVAVEGLQLLLDNIGPAVIRAVVLVDGIVDCSLGLRYDLELCDVVGSGQQGLLMGNRKDQMPGGSLALLVGAEVAHGFEDVGVYVSVKM